ncbi:MAG: hypothetical protein IIA66_04455 [Planctomycetes bacterium]|nr:hypothetical protein [Planctomycetota bacterium]
MKIEPVVIIDRREKNPWRFSNLRTEPGSLTTGDYSVWGLERMALPLFLSRERGCVSAGAQSGGGAPPVFCLPGRRY